MLFLSTSYASMKLFTINGVCIKAFGKLRMSGLKRGFVKHWLKAPFE